MQINNKKFKAVTSVLGLALIFLCGNNFALAVGEEKIDSFDVTVKMNTDASVDVTERIDYDFGQFQKHGIYRDIPVRYAARGGNYNVRLSDVSVVDTDGATYEFVVSDSGNNKEIKIGNADTLVTGAKTYIISYKVKRVINYLGNYDELYWNVTGNRFIVPIVQASAQVSFPEVFRKEDTQIKCFSGLSGSADACDMAGYILSSDSGFVGGANFVAQDLSAGEGLTVVVGVPRGIIYQPTASEVFRETLIDNIVLFVPFLVFILAFCIWRKRGKDPKGRGTIITEFDVPDNVTPAEAGTMVDEKCDQKELSAEIIELAVKGYLKIRRQEKEMLFVKSAEYYFEKLKEADESLSEHEKILLGGIFEKGNSVKLSDLKNTFYKKYNLFVKEVYGSVSQKGYFFKNPQEARVKYFVIYLFILIGFFLIIFNFLGGVFGAYAILSLVVSFAIIGIFSFAMPQKTESGVLLKEKILGLKNYLTVAEKDRLEFHNAPEKNPEQFEKLLPYAITLGVEKEWAKQFVGIYNASPSWYEDSRGFNNFTALYFVNSLGDFRSDFSSSAVTSPAASGSSGFGGGGFSGGGFGGGGGGSW
ncbi:MAG: DUF2207 domain-containing protein [Candidatus Pacebacteria bacterium]|nr:DUF2207 domain-containing protein [Candidatus Paceibacterota bacterium]